MGGDVRRQVGPAGQALAALAFSCSSFSYGVACTHDVPLLCLYFAVSHLLARNPASSASSPLLHAGSSSRGMLLDSQAA